MANKFKSMGEAILHGFDRKPKSVSEFLKEPPEKTDIGVDLHKDTPQPAFDDQQPHKPTKTQINNTPGTGDISNPRKDSLDRIHIEIRQDLADSLLEMVFHRKRNPNIKGRDSTQRAIIEEALEQYFKNHLSE